MLTFLSVVYVVTIDHQLHHHQHQEPTRHIHCTQFYTRCMNSKRSRACGINHVHVVKSHVVQFKTRRLQSHVCIAEELCCFIFSGGNYKHAVATGLVYNAAGQSFGLDTRFFGLDTRLRIAFVPQAVNQMCLQICYTARPAPSLVD